MAPRRARALGDRVGDDPAAELRDLLVDTTERLLATTPVSSITTRDIARTAGVSDGVLYNYFRDKNELVLAALARRYSALAAAFEAGLPRPGAVPIEESIAWFARAVFDLVSQSMPLVAGLIVEPVLFHRLIDEIHALPNGPQHLQRRIMEFVQGERDLGRLGPDADPEAVATLVLGSTVALALSVYLAPAAAHPAAGLEAAAPTHAGAASAALTQERVAAVVRTLIGGVAPKQ